MVIFIFIFVIFGIGFYAGYSKFAGAWSKGIAGDMFHAGLTGGWQLPVYKCKQGAIDLDLGLSVGAAYAEYDKYKYEDNHLIELKRYTNPTRISLTTG